ncbi:uncharacterized protein LOC126851078 [Cataglyphis hispanica]|uniref:uncharacterized protein LOC126851078 n=1 Tax=Cataglyphis hispanica TaxID=1086592 RepID=UPI00217FFE70|nr:uncharacterized protein LOC126851078 [Cataglyphis hispanica]
MNIRPFVCIIAVVLFAVLHFGTSEEAKKFKCYDCDSRLNGNCANNLTSIKQTNCTPSVICSKCDYELSNKTKFVTRGCGFSSDLHPSAELNNGACTLCTGDLCNNANMATISMTALGCLASFWAIRSILTNSY